MADIKTKTNLVQKAIKKENFVFPSWMIISMVSLSLSGSYSYWIISESLTGCPLNEKPDSLLRIIDGVKPIEGSWSWLV